MKKIKKAAVYARCSTNRDQKPEVQIEELRRYCIAREFLVVKELIDHGLSGTNDQRTGLKELLALVRSRDVDVVVVVKLDRLFRSLKHLVTTIQEFADLGVEFISTKDQIDLTTSSGRLMMHILASFSEFEVSLIRERTILGLEHARRKGKVLGRPYAGNYKKINELRNGGLTYEAIGTALNVSKGTVWRALNTPQTPPKNTVPEDLKEAANRTEEFTPQSAE